MTTTQSAITGIGVAIASVTLGLLLIWPPLALIVGGLLTGGMIALVAVAAALQNARGPEDD